MMRRASSGAWAAGPAPRGRGGEPAGSKSYPIVRPLYFYYTKSNEAAVRPLVDYLTSDEGQAMVASIGFIPIR